MTLQVAFFAVLDSGGSGGSGKTLALAAPPVADSRARESRQPAGGALKEEITKQEKHTADGWEPTVSGWDGCQRTPKNASLVALFPCTQQQQKNDFFALFLVCFATDICCFRQLDF